MTVFLWSAAGFVLATVAVGLVRVVRGPQASDRMMAAQLLGSGGIAVLLLTASAGGLDAALDAAIALGLLAPLATVAFARSAPVDRSPSDASSLKGGSQP